MPAKKNKQNNNNNDKKEEASAGTEFITSTQNVAPTTTTTTTKPASPTTATTSAPSTTTPKPPKQSKIQSCIYISLVILSVGALLWLVFVSMQPVSFSPCAMINGTWFVSHEDAALSPLLIGKYSGPSYTDSIMTFLGLQPSTSEQQKKQPQQQKSGNPEAVLSEYELIEQEKVNKNIVTIDLDSCVDFTTDSLRFPEEVLPIDIAPRHVEPLQIEEFSKTYNGGAKTLWWTGNCKSKHGVASVVDSKCTLMVLRGHWSLAVFPFPNHDDAVDSQTEKKKANDNTNEEERQIPSRASAISSLEPYTVIGTRLDANEVAEEAVFNRKVKYVLGIMFGVGLIHYVLSFFQPPNPKKLKREVALAKLLAIEKQKLAQVQAANAAAAAAKK